MISQADTILFCKFCLKFFCRVLRPRRESAACRPPVSADFVAETSGQEDVPVEKISDQDIINIQFVPRGSKAVAGGNHFVTGASRTTAS